MISTFITLFCFIFTCLSIYSCVFDMIVNWLKKTKTPINWKTNNIYCYCIATGMTLILTLIEYYNE